MMLSVVLDDNPLDRVLSLNDNPLDRELFLNGNPPNEDDGNLLDEVVLDRICLDEPV